MRGEALVSVSSIYNPRLPPLIPSDSLVIFFFFFCPFSKDFFHFQTPSFWKNHFCVYLLCLPSSLPPLFLSLCLQPSPCVVLISDRQCSRSQHATENSSTKNSELKKKDRERRHWLTPLPRHLPFSFFDAFHLISLTSHLPLTKKERRKKKKHPFRVSVTESLLIFLDTFGYQLQKLSLTRREEDGKTFTALTCLSRIRQLQTGRN